jgi:hypothetical protein
LATSKVTILGHEPGAIGGGTIGAIGFAAAALLLLLYLLQERRVRVVVSHAALWIGAAVPGAEARLGRRFSRLRSWLLQMAILLVLLVAAADPRPVTGGAGARHIVLLVDRSASMGAIAGTGTRLDVARVAARRALATLGPGDRLLVGSFAATATAESGFEADQSRLEEAIAGITVAPENGDLGTAIRFARAILTGRASPTVILIGDGAYAEAELQAARKGSWSLHTIAVQEQAVDATGLQIEGNVVLGSLAVDGRAEGHGGDVTVSVALRRYGGRAGPVPVELRDDLGRRLGAETLLVDAGGTAIARLSLEARAARGLTARITLPPGPENLLGFDDAAFATIPQARKRRVLITGGPNLYLEGALLSLGPSVEVTRLSTEELARVRPVLSSYDLVILDGVAPAPPPTEGRFLYVGAGGPGSPFPERGAPVREPAVVHQDREHPVTRHLPLADLNFKEARSLRALPGDRVLARAFTTPLVLVRETERLKIVALAFDIQHSDLPLRPTLPLLIANTLDWMAPPLDLPAQHHRAGTLATVALPFAARLARVVGPDGAVSTIAAAGGTAQVPLPQPGLYRISGDTPGDAPVTLAANLRLPGESDTSAAAPPSWANTHRLPLGPVEPPLRPSVTTLALLLAALLLAIEWWSLHRGWTI